VDADDHVYVCEQGAGRVLKIFTDANKKPVGETKVIAKGVDFTFSKQHLPHASGIVVGTLD
jgi:hypothetical protein